MGCWSQACDEDMVPAYKLNSLQNRAFQVLNLNHGGGGIKEGELPNKKCASHANVFGN